MSSFYQRDVDHPEAASQFLCWAAERMEGASPADPKDLYNLVCVLAQCAALASMIEPDESFEAQARSEDYRNQALEVLRQAIEAGYKDIKSLNQDPDLDPLRPWEDFQALLADLAFPADPFAR